MIREFVLFYISDVGFYITGVSLFPNALEDSGRSGRLAGTMFTYAGTSPAL